PLRQNEKKSVKRQHEGITTDRGHGVKRIPGSIKYPFYALYENEVSFKPPREVLYMLKTKGITADKTIILTSKTGAWAGAAFFALRYLGYPDVRVHHQSWVGWCNEYCSFDD
ncbi:MAG: rhodanese-like domain-containing protein, partial [Desulfobacterales bacterium]|nr:rhodanese-like domain-containing protein [Desulfobacterales bacterium]MDX2513102.1 rhodanese-like domain-containing protein [Desulfobacterales bacterium]